MSAAPTRTDPQSALSRTRRTCEGAAQTRKLLRRELRRVAATGVSLYVDGRRGSVRLTSLDGARRRCVLPASDALAVLQALPDGAGLEAALDALAQHCEA